jgi:hypothetical protein
VNRQLNIAVICHDAGAANSIFAWIQEVSHENNFQMYLSGPALEIWGDRRPSISLCQSVEEAITDVDFVLTGTGWTSDVEFEALRLSKARQIKTVAVLDHWVNYEVRFTRKGSQILPDEIWASDDKAFDLASKTFPNTKIVQVVNYYLRDQVQQINAHPKVNEAQLLYLTEPIRSTWGKSEQGEFQALRYFLNNKERLAIPNHVRIVLKVHPSEEYNKYDEIVREYNKIDITVTSLSLSSELSRSVWVVGCNTFAMYIALSAGKSVFSSLPPWAPKLLLPFDEIVEIRNV